MFNTVLLQQYEWVFLAKACCKVVFRRVKNPEALIFLSIPTIKYLIVLNYINGCTCTCMHDQPPLISLGKIIHSYGRHVGCPLQSVVVHQVALTLVSTVIAVVYFLVYTLWGYHCNNIDLLYAYQGRSTHSGRSGHGWTGFQPSLSWKSHFTRPIITAFAWSRTWPDLVYTQALISLA